MTAKAQNAASQLTDEQFSQYAIEILQRELGADGVARFLRVYRPGSGDYTRDRHKWLKGITLEQIISEIKERREIVS